MSERGKTGGSFEEVPKVDIFGPKTFQKLMQDLGIQGDFYLKRKDTYIGKNAGFEVFSPSPPDKNSLEIFDHRQHKEALVDAVATLLGTDTVGERFGEPGTWEEAVAEGKTAME